MEIKKMSNAGTMESSDIFVVIEKGYDGIEINLNSTVTYQYGDQIRSVIKQTLESIGMFSAKVTATDRGALDCTIRARVLAAAYRAAESVDYDWSE
ncbi:citrate lyase acyl carrier protein [Geosporobacter ferrireducens]|uniref:Citrate lyase acyl carrier protein n=1 Tax=Geosporobacter ferrireducens TaxID=1424294 RepID=A0A1D8GFB7_9FIRM|nr:citrate lyase acyl carrier protein [Geosporobacter ferrireducens]AOT69604.1 citrate lyase acyl carrier protein [Geosporobacter ferrireducens]MTI54698.1 citrate lyase acyl carrier protein [Geosporobacter ferrireducens]